MPMPHAIDGQAEKCQHGYWLHAHVRCPWCVGFSAETADVVPVAGPGNGWLLRTGQTPCMRCGGPGGAGYGLLPSFVTSAWAEAVKLNNRYNYCYGCHLEAPPTPAVKARIYELREEGVPLAVRQEAAASHARIMAQTTRPFTFDKTDEWPPAGGERF